MTKIIDLYTKIILTVIAVCLVYIITKDINIVPEAQAQSRGSAIDVNIVSVAGDTIKTENPYGTALLFGKQGLPVRIID